MLQLVPKAGNVWGMRGELASLLKAAGRLCQETNSSLSKEEGIVCAELAGLVRRTGAVTTATTPQPPVILSSPAQSPNFHWDENDSWLEENISTWNSSLSLDKDQYYDSVLMIVLSVVLGVVILITVVGKLVPSFIYLIFFFYHLICLLCSL